VACAFHSHCQECVSAGRERSPLLAAGTCASCPAVRLEEVHVSGHALDRISERAGLGGLTAVKKDVRAALRHGRTGDAPPPSLKDRPRPARPPHVYAWPSSLERLFVLAKGRRGGIVVVTVLTPPYELERSAAPSSSTRTPTEWRNE